MPESTETILFAVKVRADKKSADAVENVEKKVDSLEASFQDLQKRSKVTGDQLQNATVQGAKKASQGMLDVSRSTQRASREMGFELVQASQDATFGIENVANQLPLLGEQWERLREQTGSTSAALSGLAGTMVGPTGVLAAGTLLIQFWPQIRSAFSGAAEDAKKAKEQIDELASAADSLITGFDEDLPEFQITDPETARRSAEQLEAAADARRNLIEDAREYQSLLEAREKMEGRGILPGERGATIPRRLRGRFDDIENLDAFVEQQQTLLQREQAIADVIKERVGTREDELAAAEQLRRTAGISVVEGEVPSAPLVPEVEAPSITEDDLIDAGRVDLDTELQLTQLADLRLQLSRVQQLGQKGILPPDDLIRRKLQLYRQILRAQIRSSDASEEETAETQAEIERLEAQLEQSSENAFQRGLQSGLQQGISAGLQPLFDSVENNLAQALIRAFATALASAAAKRLAALLAPEEGDGPGGAAGGQLFGSVFGALLSSFFGGAFARGGVVRGPGTSTSDSIVAALSDGEFVLSAEAVSRAGGPKAVTALHEAMRSGSFEVSADQLMRLTGIPGFAHGGLVDLTQPVTRIRRKPSSSSNVEEVAAQAAQAAADQTARRVAEELARRPSVIQIGPRTARDIVDQADGYEKRTNPQA